MIIQPGVLNSAAPGVTPEPTDSAILVPPVAIIPYPITKPYSSYITAPASTGEPSYTSIAYHASAVVTGPSAPSTANLALLAPGVWTIVLTYFCEALDTGGGAARTISGATSNGAWGISMAQLGDVVYKDVLRVSPNFTGFNVVLTASGRTEFTMNFQRNVHFLANYGRNMFAGDALQYVATIVATKHD